ncbi:MAG: MFS transporter [Deltaproteobacteria bacterium]|nr:MFS transporter [Deltaproteobacteria bacterium]
MNSKTSNREAKVFYGWYVLIASSIILFFNQGARVSIGIMFKPMILDLGWDRSSISLAVFLNFAVFALAVSFVGKFYDRYGPKWVIIVSTVLLSFGYMGISIINDLWEFIILYGIFSAAGLGGTAVPIFSAIAGKWFERRRGLAISLALAGNCLGQFALVPLFTLFVLRYGWRMSHFLIGFIMLVVNVTLTLLVIRGDPKELGYNSYGTGQNIQRKVGENTGPSPDETEGLSLGMVIKTRSFWFFSTIMFICGSADFMITTHFIPFVTDQGVSAATGGNMLAWAGLMSLAGILIVGPVSDMIGNKVPIAATFILRFLLFSMILKYQNVLSFYVFSLFFGMTFLVTAVTLPTLSGKLYGTANLGAIIGVITTIHHVGGGFWAYVAGVVFDRTGGYQAVFLISAVMAAIAVFCTLGIREERHYAGG